MKKRLLLMFVLIAFSFSGKVNAQYALSYSGGVDGVFEVVPGSTVTIDYTYTAAMDVGSQFQVFLTPVPGIFGGDPEGTDAMITFANPMLTAGTDVAGSVDINVPMGTTLSADLTGDLEYRIFGKLANDQAFWDVDGVYPLLDVVATLSTDEFKKENGFSFGIKNQVLTINGAISGSKVHIIDMSGRTVLTSAINGSTTNKVDLVGLNHGVYALINDTGNGFKFAF